MKHLIWVVFYGLFHCMVAQAGAVEDGQALLVSGDLNAATEKWEAVLDEGAGSATLHYNLGTTWYRRGRLAKAIAHWRMGRVLSPRDPNLVHNLAVARSELTEIPEPLDTQPVLSQIATPTEWGILGFCLLIVSSLGLWVTRMHRKTGPWPWLGVGILGLIVSVLSGSMVYSMTQYPGAVITDENAFLRALSVRDAEVLGQIGEGTEVAVEGVHQEFVLVRTSQDLRGWIPKDSVLFVGNTWNSPP